MAINRMNINTFRVCKRCAKNKTGITKLKDGTLKENWYIDKKSPHGGWLCSSCANKLKRIPKFIVKEIEFEISSINQQSRGLYV